MKHTLHLLSIILLLSAQVCRAQSPEFQTGASVTMPLVEKTPTGERSAKESIPWGMGFNNIPATMCTMNNIVFRFQELKTEGKFSARMLSGVYYSLVRAAIPNDVQLDLELLDAGARVIGKASLQFARKQQSLTETFQIDPKPEVEGIAISPASFPHPIRDAVAVRISPKWHLLNEESIPVHMQEALEKALPFFKIKLKR